MIYVSVGTLYALCNNNPPFLYRMESKDEKPAPLSDEFSQSLKDLTMECLSFDPGSRPDAHKIFRQAEEQLAIVQSQPVTKARLMSHKKGWLSIGVYIFASNY